MGPNQYLTVKVTLVIAMTFDFPDFERQVVARSEFKPRRSQIPPTLYRSSPSPSLRRSYGRVVVISAADSRGSEF